MQAASPDEVGTAATPLQIVIVGGGIIGAATAYYLGKCMGEAREGGRRLRVTLVEREEIACSASGKAGGFLARDWCDGTPTEALAHLSFDLHAAFAREVGPEAIGFREVVTASAGVVDASGRACGAPGWLDGPLYNYQPLGTPGCTAQVHPRLLTELLARRAEALGVVVRAGIAVSAVVPSGDSVAVELSDGTALQANSVVLATGPWTPYQLSALLGARAPESPDTLLVHSIVLRSRASVAGGDVRAEERKEGCEEWGVAMRECIFCAGKGSCEIYPRPSGEVYVCGYGAEEVPVPRDTAFVALDESKIRLLHQLAGTYSSRLRCEDSAGAGMSVEAARQACFLPLSPDGAPMIGEVPGCRGVFVASGHSCWGILLSHGTGLLVAEGVLSSHGVGTSKTFASVRVTREYGAAAARLSRLHPRRFIAGGPSDSRAGDVPTGLFGRKKFPAAADRAK